MRRIGSIVVGAMTALNMALGGFVVPNVAQAAKAVCNDDVRAGKEQCDGSDDEACPGQCQADCTCASASDPLEARLAALEALLAAVTLEDGGATLRITGVNVEIVDGSGDTHGATNGLGNLIIGYNENTTGALRDGSHNLVIGKEHTYRSYGGFVCGEQNSLEGSRSAAIGGLGNRVTGEYAASLGGNENQVGGEKAVVAGGNKTISTSSISFAGGGHHLQLNPTAVGSAALGGSNNTVNGDFAAIAGGILNVANGTLSGMVGGADNMAGFDNSDLFTTVTGGTGNQALGVGSSITGGDSNTTGDQAWYSVISGGISNVTGADNSSITGGDSNTTGAAATSSVVSGGLNRSTTGVNEWRAGSLNEPF